MSAQFGCLWVDLKYFNLDLDYMRLDLCLGTSFLILDIDLVLYYLPHPALHFLQENIEKDKTTRRQN